MEPDVNFNLLATEYQRFFGN